jgi:hypothetical protein
LSYRLPHNWSLSASYSITRVITHSTAITAGVVRSSDVNFGPQAFVAAVGYSF